jgi:5-dehydro-2-deoxygluconokinase
MVDLYCDQIGSPLEEGQSLSMYVGGCPTNVAVGARRLGLRVAMLTRVGDDGTGRFIVRTLQREGIDTSRVRPDPAARTPVVVVAIQPPDHFPITWYRERAADLELTGEDFDEPFLASARALLVSGHSLSRPASARTLLHLVRLARQTGTLVLYDVDFRPVLWRRQGGEALTDQEIRQALQAPLPCVDLLVGTEEEYLALTGCPRAEEAFEEARRLFPGTAVLKRGPRGALAAPPGGPPVAVPAFPVPILNTLGAGDAFLAGFLSGWLGDRPLADCLRRGNACGALVVSRHGCAPAMPYASEVEHFLVHHGGAPQDDPTLEALHAAGELPPAPDPLFILALDHRDWFAARAGPDRITAFKALAVRALAQARADWRPNLGFLLDGLYGAQAMALAGSAWLGQPLEVSGSCPLKVEAPGGDPALALRERPRERAVKVLVRCEARDPAWLWERQILVLSQVQAACRAYRRALVLEVLPRSRSAQVTRQVERLRAAGLCPTWWKLPLPARPGGLERLAASLGSDPGCRGVLFLGGGLSLAELAARLPLVSGHPLARGWAVGRSLFQEPFRLYLEGAPEAAVASALRQGYEFLVRAWQGQETGPRTAK